MTFKKFDSKVPIWLVSCATVLVCVVGLVAFIGVYYLIITYRSNLLVVSNNTLASENGTILFAGARKNNINYENHKDQGYRSLPQELPIVNRLEWMAELAKSKVTHLITPVPYVIIMHTATQSCYDRPSCSSKVRNIQHYHMYGRDWKDIAYNFLVSGDGLIYEGRGWQAEGGHNHSLHNRSISIAGIGNFNIEMPTMKQLVSLQELIEGGISMGYIDNDYKLLGAKQVQNTESPGMQLYENIKTWAHWVDRP